MKKTFITLIIIVGISFLLGAAYLLLSPSAAQEKFIGILMAIMGFLLSLGPNIQGWREVFEKVDLEETHTGRIGIRNGAPAEDQNALHQLPSAPKDFTGRRIELETLHQQIQSGSTALEIQGIGGVGKTALGLKLAEQLTGDYPDAQIFIDLRGVDAEGQKPRSVEEIMSMIIKWFQPRREEFPVARGELRGLYFSVLHDKKALLFFDNVHSAEQVEPLLPPGTCLLILTSRHTLSLPGTYILNLHTADPADARSFIQKILPGIGKADATALARQCGYLPLAMRVAASILITRPDWTPAFLIGKLRSRQIRLNLVEASLRLSYDLLDKEAKWRFRQLTFFKWYFARVPDEREIMKIAIRTRLGIPGQKISQAPKPAREIEYEARDVSFGRDSLSYIWSRDILDPTVFLPFRFFSFHQVEHVSYQLKPNVKKYLRYHPVTDESIDKTLALLLKAGLIEFDIRTLQYKMHDLTSLFCEELLFRGAESLVLSFKLRAWIEQEEDAAAAERERMAGWLAAYHRQAEEFRNFEE